MRSRVRSRCADTTNRRSEFRTKQRPSSRKTKQTPTRVTTGALFFKSTKVPSGFLPDCDLPSQKWLALSKSHSFVYLCKCDFFNKDHCCCFINIGNNVNNNKVFEFFATFFFWYVDKFCLFKFVCFMFFYCSTFFYLFTLCSEIGSQKKQTPKFILV